MYMRSFHERLFQIILLEALGIGIAAPLYGAFTGIGHPLSYGLLLTLAVVATCVAPFYHAAFDRVDWALNQRLASDRSPVMRAVHAVGHEGVLLAVTLPITVYLTGQTPVRAFTATLGLTLFYVVYVWAFYRVYDRFRPVPTARAHRSGWVYLPS